MNKGVIGVFSFAAGAAAGFAAAFIALKEKYEQMVQDEVDSVKAAFRREHPLPKKESKPTARERREYAQFTQKLGYSENGQPAPQQEPRIIAPEEFGEEKEYDQISLTCYADGTVTDDNDRPMDEAEIAETIGKDSLKHFGEYEEDSVFVRNDRLKVDYEILADLRTYEAVLREKPYLKM